MRPLLSTLIAVALLSATAVAQDSKRVSQEEQEDYYSKWLREDVYWIISEEERDIFEKLSTDQEKDSFIESFWFRRDPDPTTSFNEFKEEHYRRVAYANERFAAGIDGWKTDRGMIYIKFGPPDRKETYPAGGQYERKRKEGGGQTTIFPVEFWEYRNIDGVGEDIELEFIDDEGGGLYELTFDNQRKDTMLHTGFASPTMDEMERLRQSGVASKQERVARRRHAGDLPGVYSASGSFERMKDMPFQQLELLGNLNRAITVKYTDLEAAVSTRISYDQLPFGVRADYIRVTPGRVTVLITLQVANQEMQFKPNQLGMQAARIQIFGRVTNLGKRVLDIFEDDLAREYRPQELDAALRRSSVYQKRLLMRPGVYKLELGIKDAHSEKMGTTELRLAVPEYPDDQLALSSVVLAHRIEATDRFEAGESAFIIGDLKVVPHIYAENRPDESLGLYLQVYNFAVDQQLLEPSLKIEYGIAPQQAATPEVWRDTSRSLIFTGSYCRVARMVNLSQLEPGSYALHVRVRDKVSGQEAASRSDFRVIH